MDRLKTISSNGKDIVYLDLRDYNYDKIFFREILHRTSQLLNRKNEPQLLLADFTGISYTHKLFEITREFISNNLSNIKAAALVGIQLEQEIDPEIVKKAFNLHILFFSDLNDAKTWLYEK
jgi:hypothetical protein